MTLFKPPALLTLLRQYKSLTLINIILIGVSYCSLLLLSQFAFSKVLQFLALNAFLCGGFAMSCALGGIELLVSTLISPQTDSKPLKAFVLFFALQLKFVALLSPLLFLKYFQSLQVSRELIIFPFLFGVLSVFPALVVYRLIFSEE